jgi:hypothetical protein
MQGLREAIAAQRLEPFVADFYAKCQQSSEAVS